MRWVEAQAVDDALELFDVLMITERLGRAERQSSKDTLRRYPRLSPVSCRRSPRSARRGPHRTPIPTGSGGPALPALATVTASPRRLTDTRSSHRRFTVSWLALYFTDPGPA
jgi:hypothetical protein